jgi:hypothetical protein
VQQIVEKSNGENNDFKLRIDAEVKKVQESSKYRKQESKQQDQQREGHRSVSISKQEEAIPWSHPREAIQ